jgi:hypothetical protein
VIFRAAIDKGFQEDGNAMSFWQKHMCWMEIWKKLFKYIMSCFSEILIKHTVGMSWKTRFSWLLQYPASERD